ncbi:iron transporter FeoB [Flavobacterium akiainvivens]|uniref:Ferrous iron transport protein B n=1 Tax=Flavobacterium akiainvivens TaxID=1202724 RepID=A0A0M9VIX6_9FLAO|nr:ferrous iron transport protein B [Flavobacterium akiainvivens]KOS07190.1 iron transporter FeoB [Flavobacterium akiainvivens]SFQ72803.1 ferrous iron transport protein B [Flavobacterium akiainvivens]
MAGSTIKIALIGNPNVGKTSVFNQLTGLNQQVGNYPGITVERKAGTCKLPNNIKGAVLDLPGTYSLNASSMDENVVIELLMNKNDKDFPDVAVVVTEVENLKRNLLLFTQIKDLEIPTILVINMSDRMEKKGITLDVPYLEEHLKTRIALVSSRKGTGMDHLKDLIVNYTHLNTEPCLNASSIDPEYFGSLRKTFPQQLLYKLWLVITQDANFGIIDMKELQGTSFTKTKSELKRLQQKETVKRYQFINDTLKIGQTIDTTAAKDLRAKLDRVLTHQVWGYAIFFCVLMLIFQSIFSWSSIPMDWIDETFAGLATWVQDSMPPGKLTDLVAQGIIPGIGGVVIFIPQIAFLFLFISLLEESGYMSRVVFLMDHIMKRFGLNGKSVVPLISGTACAIPAIMAARNIENWRERLITILVTPFTTCSARLPVYTILISLIIPERYVLGIFNLQGLTLMLLYMLGFAMAILSAWILNKVLDRKFKTFFVAEMPNYKVPMFKNVAINVLEKTKAFVVGAGKIILALSILIWFLGSHGPGDDFNNAEEIVTAQPESQSLPENELADKVASYQLENSYIGIMGHAIEPVIKPLGYDWKIGIAIVSSFAAREVFVGTLATIYNIGSSGEDENTIRSRMEAEINPVTKEKTFNFATGASLLLFYALAMQCISTLAIVKKETNSWKWPVVQLVFMSGIAYLASLIAFQLLQ